VFVVFPGFPPAHYHGFIPYNFAYSLDSIAMSVPFVPSALLVQVCQLDIAFTQCDAPSR
jgi:hypothetical protein